MLIVKGDNLNTSLLPADYKVYLVDDDVSTIIPCNVVELLEKELKCEPIFNQSYLSIQSTDTWPVSIEVCICMPVITPLSFMIAKNNFCNILPTVLDIFCVLKFNNYE